MCNRSKRQTLVTGLWSVIIAAGVGSIVLASPVLAKDLIWDRNSEIDIQDYLVYGCQTANCVVLKTQANLLATVPQTAAGVLPKWTLPTALVQGELAVSARDKSQNESGLSVPLPLDLVPPAAPTNLRVQ